MKHEEYIEANRRSWNQTADIHERATLADLLEQVQQEDFCLADPIEKQAFEQIGIHGKAVAQLCCNNGRELLSLKNQGAGTCIGFDLSEKFVAQGERLARVSGLDVQFVAGSVYDIPDQYDQQFEVVTVTIGALGWLPDLPGFFAVIDRLLKPGGHVFIYEMHPILDMFEAENGLEIQHCYFRQEPYKETGGQDYMDPNSRITETYYWFHHKMSDVITGVLDCGLQLQQFKEYDHDLSNVFAAFATFEKKPPLCYSLIAQKNPER